jgi:hypothetical protein
MMRWLCLPLLPLLLLGTASAFLATTTSSRPRTFTRTLVWTAAEARNSSETSMENISDYRQSMNIGRVEDEERRTVKVGLVRLIPSPFFLRLALPLTITKSPIAVRIFPW